MNVVSQLTAHKREQLLKLAKSLHLKNKVAPLPQIPRVERSSVMLLSFAQQRLWFLGQMEGGSRAYHMPLGVRLRGRLDGAALKQALDRLVWRHEPLRTTFVAVEGEPRQRIARVEESDFHLQEHDLGGHADVQSKDAQGELERLMAEEAGAEFDLEAGPLIRGRLIRLSEEEHALLISMHHIVSDGWSMGVLFQELSALYGAYVRGEADPLPELGVQYADYAVWQRKWVEGEVLKEQAEYWKKNLGGAPELVELPLDRARLARQDYAGAALPFLLNEQLTSKLKELSARHGTTLYMTLLAGWALLLARLSGQQDVVIGTPVANRGRVEIEKLIGFFVNTLVLRVEVSGRPTVREVLERVKRQAIAAQGHQDIPFEQVVELVQPVRSLAHSALFQVMFAWQDTAEGNAQLPELEIEALQMSPHVVSKFDMTLALQESGGRIEGGVEYATALFEGQTVERYLGYFTKLLEGMVGGDGSQVVDEIAILEQEERGRVVKEWNRTEVEYPREKCVHELFEEQVERTPDAMAVVEEGRQLTYEELNRRSNRLAHHLRGLGVQADARVGICVERSVEMVVGLLGIMKAGGAYVPLDPGYPGERLRYMVEDSRPAVLLTQGDLQERLGGISERVPVVDLSDFLHKHQQLPAGNLERRVTGLTAKNLAYVIYTSGSTGTPKGAMNQHEGVVNRLLWMQDAYGLKAEEDAVLQKTPFSFDVSVWEFFWPLLAGAKLVMARPEGHKDPGYLVESIYRHGITTMHFVPPMLQVFVEQVEAERCGSLQRVMCSGEALPAALVQQFGECLPGVELHNLYGPTEAAVDVTAWKCAPEKPETIIPIGAPIANTQMYVLDGESEAVPVRVRGALYIGGVQVGRGYLNRAELTAEKFVPDAFAEEGGARIYKTGDVGRWRDDGTIEFLGRNDFQVKIRGFRIELGEIEARLMEHEGVREAVVIAREDQARGKRLVAYYTAREHEHDEGEAEKPQNAGATAEQFRAYLTRKMPEYMVPSAYVRLEKLPLTANGKLDRKALPEPEGDALAARGYEAPEGEIETTVALIWQDVLKVERVGRHDNFFALGGHSLLMMQTSARLRQTLGVEVALDALFLHPVLTHFARQLHSRPTFSKSTPATENIFFTGASGFLTSLLPAESPKPSGSASQFAARSSTVQEEPRRSPSPYREEEVAYPNKAGGNILAATLTIPHGKGPFPAVVLITGTGPHDRDETIMGHKPFLVLADYLSRRGIAVLRADNRGVGKSTGVFFGSTMADFATDTEAGIVYLRARPEVNPRMIGLIGHSEGGIIAPMVAAHNPEVAFIVMLAGTGVRGDELIVSRVERLAEMAGKSREEALKNGEKQRRILAMVEEAATEGLMEEHLRQEFANEMSGEQIKAFTRQLNHRWLRFFVTYDPTYAFRKVTCPVLALNGGKDLLVPAEQNLPPIRRALEASGNRNFEIKELPGLNHLFQTASTGAPWEYAEILETIAPIALEKISDWILKVTTQSIAEDPGNQIQLAV